MILALQAVSYTLSFPPLPSGYRGALQHGHSPTSHCTRDLRSIMLALPQNLSHLVPRESDPFCSWAVPFRAAKSEHQAGGPAVSGRAEEQDRACCSRKDGEVPPAYDAQALQRLHTKLRVALCS